MLGITFVGVARDPLSRGIMRNATMYDCILDDDRY